MSEERLQLDQCLFGYDDGHRLLASSIDLGLDVSKLTELSDLAPGAVFSRSTGYWTGVPVPGLRRYALMRTWPAPEMSRPGCVWTHALLLRPELFERVPDLVTLAPLLVRPTGPADRPRYRETVALAPPSLNLRFETTFTPGGLVRELLASLYDGTRPVLEIGEPGEIDDAVFAVWSQQWPRLRRNLRFQTAATREQWSNGAGRFDVVFVLQPDAPRREPTSPDLPWLNAAEKDASARTGGALRSFLWRFGTDVRRQRGSFRPLVEVWLLDGEADDVGAKVLEVVTGNFPDLEDAGSLKRALVDGEILPRAQLEILWYVLAQGGGEVFPAPTEAGIGRLALLWPERPGDLLHLADKTADADDALGRSVFATVTGALPTDGFWRLVGHYPRLCQRMVQSRPELLLSDDALELDDGTLAELVETLSGDSSVGEPLVSRLLGRESDRLANVVLDQFGASAAAQVLGAINAGHMRVGRAWFRALVGRPALLLDAPVMGRIKRTSLLYEVADALGWLAPAVVAAGTEPWIAALVDVASDLPEDRRAVLRSFLVALAISSGGDGGRRVLEKFFAVVHEAEMRSRLPWRAREILIHALPDIGWSRAWDYGLRLRMAAALAYVRNGYPPESYGRLLSGRKGRALLADAASRVQGGNPYATAAED